MVIVRKLKPGENLTDEKFPDLRQMYIQLHVCCGNLFGATVYVHRFIIVIIITINHLSLYWYIINTACSPAHISEAHDSMSDKFGINNHTYHLPPPLPSPPLPPLLSPLFPFPSLSFPLLPSLLLLFRVSAIVSQEQIFADRFFHTEELRQCLGLACRQALLDPLVVTLAGRSEPVHG